MLHLHSCSPLEDAQDGRGSGVVTAQPPAMEYFSAARVPQFIGGRHNDGPTFQKAIAGIHGGNDGPARPARAGFNHVGQQLYGPHAGNGAPTTATDGAPEAAPIATGRSVSVGRGQPSDGGRRLACDACLGSRVSAHLWGPCRHCAGTGIAPIVATPEGTTP